MENIQAIFSSDLTWIILLPLLGSLIVYVSPTKQSRWIALAFSVAVFVLSLTVFFRILGTGKGFGDLQNLRDAVDVGWINFQAGSVNFKIDYFLGVDGLSLPMVILNGLLTMLAVIGGWEKKRTKEYLALLLFLEAGVMGV